MLTRLGGALTVTNDDIASKSRGWWSADTGVTQSGTVSQWIDKISSSALTPIGAGQPTYVANAINGLPGVQFVTTTGTGLKSPNLNLNNQPFTLLVVFRYDGVSVDSSQIISTDFPTNFGQSISLRATSAIGVEFFRGFTYSTFALTVGQSYIAVATWTNNRYKLWVNNTLRLDVTYTSGAITGLSYLTLGTDPTNNFRTAVTISEAMVFNDRSITDAERVTLTNSFNSKYAIF